MLVMVQIRNMPEDIHRKMKSRAALAGMSLSEYLLSEIRQVAERPTVEEMRARLATRTPVITSESSVDIIRAERDRA
jgi:plasmid stability protein